MQTRRNGPANASPVNEADAAELAAWLKSLGVTREQLERAFRANASRAYPASRASGRPSGR
jgi:hypothetical protein